MVSDQPQRQQDKQHVQTAVHPEALALPSELSMVRKVAPTIVGNPVGRCGAGDTEVAAFQRLDFEHSTQISGPALMAKPTMNISSIRTAMYCAVEE